jgi:phosphomannomutase/phosphoglucomutase
MDRLAKLMDSQPAPTGTPRRACTRKDLLPDYLSFLTGHTPDLSGLKVVIDCANGMTGLVARRAWEKTGAEVSYLFEEVDGRFPAHAPNPAELKNLALLRQAVREQGADLGVAYDGDGDRVAFVDKNGEALVNDKVIVLFAREMLRFGPETIVYDQKCSRIVPDAIRGMGGRPVMELSGHTFIKRAFLEHKAAYAGELSGHHFVRAFDGDDAPAASMLFARILRDSRSSLAQLAAQIPSYPITPDFRIPMRADEVQRVLSELEANLAGCAALSKTDGLRIEFADGWALVRPSVTEPLLTLRCEGIDDNALRDILERLRSASPLLSRLGKNKLQSDLAH